MRPAEKCGISADPDPAGHKGREARPTRDLTTLQVRPISLEEPLSQGPL